MDKETALKVHVNDLIILCNIIDEFEVFNKNILDFVSSNNNKNLMDKLFYVSTGKHHFNMGRVKRFYENNKKVIDIINKYSNVAMFIWENYNYKGEPIKLSLFYQYILKNKDKLDQIIALLEKLKELSFKDLEFNENFDFTNEEYKIYTIFGDNVDIAYLDNMEVLPNYEKGIVKYKTTVSNYKIIISPIHILLSNYSSQIISVNSLAFDPERLPSSITKEEVFDKIIDLKSTKKEECSAIRDSVDLSECIADLNTQFNYVNNTVNNLDDARSKSELIEVLSNIKQDIEKLQTICEEHDNRTLEENPTITRETLDKEKKLCLEKRRPTVFIEYS